MTLSYDSVSPITIYVPAKFNLILIKQLHNYDELITITSINYNIMTVLVSFTLQTLKDKTYSTTFLPIVWLKQMKLISSSQSKQLKNKI